MLVCLVTGTAYSEPQANKPFKVCPEEFVTVKDAPCRILGPTAAVVQRMEKPNEDKKKIAEMQQRIQMLEAKVLELQRNR